MIRMHLYPLAAATIARPIPVLPLVLSTMVVLPGEMSPRFSASSIIESAMRSLTLPPGFCISSLTSTVAAPSGTTRLSLTIGGVLPMISVTELA